MHVKFLIRLIDDLVSVNVNIYDDELKCQKIPIKMIELEGRTRFFFQKGSSSIMGVTKWPNLYKGPGDVNKFEFLQNNTFTTFYSFQKFQG